MSFNKYCYYGSKRTNVSKYGLQLNVSIYVSRHRVNFGFPH
jgi:hypothetical protein